MALAYMKQTRDLYFIDTFVADGGPLTANKSASVLLNKESLIKEFLLKFKEFNGKESCSKLIEGSKVNYVRLTEPVKKIGKTIEFKPKYTDQTLKNKVGETVSIEMRVNYRTSEITYVDLVASAVVKDDSTTVTIAKELAGQLQFALGNDVRTGTNRDMETGINGMPVAKNRYFDITVNGGDIKIKEKDNWIQERFTLVMPETELMWEANGRFYGDIMESTAFTSVIDYGQLPVNQGYQMLEFEDFLTRGRAEFDTFNPGYALHRNHIADINKDYVTVDLSFFNQSMQDPKHADQMIMVAFESKDKAQAQALVDAILSAIGSTPVAPVVVDESSGE